jgi:thiosulfate/3-mercaptopyruvate sulfurtransferase
MDALVTTEWLANELGAASGASDLRIVDATYAEGRDAAAEFEAAHIPGAVFMNLSELRDTDSDLPNMLPSAEKFANRMQTLGLGDGSRIVLYDSSPWHTAARAWWMLRLFGAHNVAILDGGLPKWRAEGRETASGEAALLHGHVSISADLKSVRDLDQMKANVESGAEQVLDARSAARFTGAEEDPRAGTAPGHIPGSKNLPQGAVFNADGTWKTGNALKAEFDKAGIDLSKPLVMTCGSGITASVLAFGAHLLGNDAALYDGSWSEWGGDPETPKATGTA